MNITRVKGTSWIVCEGGKGILIDAGMHRDAKCILKKIDQLGIQLTLIFLTHTHYDHTGSAESVRRATGAKVIVGAAEADCLRQGHTLVPKGTGFFSKMIGRAGHDVDAKHREYYEPVVRDIIEIERDQSLSPYGFDAVAIPLGGHSIGSIGLKVGEHLFAGDVVFGLGHVIYPMFADFEEDIPTAWQAILQSGAQYIYPGHGRRLDTS